MNEKQFIARLNQKIKLTPSVMKIAFLLEKKEISFRAGQHIIVHIPLGNEIVERPFSIASSPLESNRVELLIKLIAGGVASTFFEKTPEGSAVRFSGPHGEFRVAPLACPVTFLASSTGVAPLRSMIYELINKEKSNLPVTLFFVTQSLEERFLENEWDAIQKRAPHFSYHMFTDLSPYFNTLSHISPETDIYLCGGNTFIQDSIAILAKNGIASERFHYETFS